ncbi:MAG: MFS transporter, partial [Reinekea sp.]|nr:MFS transporter [Reinekea sp.]
MSTSNKTVYVGVILAGLLDSLALGIIMPILPFIALDLGANAFWIGALFAVQFVGGALGSPILGRLADVVPRGALLIISLVSIALGNWALLFASSIPMLILIRGFVGFMSSNLVILESIVADMTSDKERSAGLAKLRLGSTLGLIIGPAILATIGSLGLFSSTAPMLILAASVTSLVPIIIGVTV